MPVVSGKHAYLFARRESIQHVIASEAADAVFAPQRHRYAVSETPPNVLQLY